MRLEGTIEWPDRTKTGVERDGEDGNARLAWIGEGSHGLGKAVAVDEGTEIAMSQLLIDQSAQAVFWCVQFRGEHGDAQAFFSVDLIVLHQVTKGLQQHGILFIGSQREGRIVLMDFARRRRACAKNTRGGELPVGGDG